MRLALPETLKPLWQLVIHLGIGALALAIVLVIEVALAGFLKLLEMVPFAPDWLRAAAEVLEQALFVVDLAVVGLFLVAEIIKFGKGLWEEVRND